MLKPYFSVSEHYSDQHSRACNKPLITIQSDPEWDPYKCEILLSISIGEKTLVLKAHQLPQSMSRRDNIEGNENNATLIKLITVFKNTVPFKSIHAVSVSISV